MEWRCEVATAAGADIFASLPDYLTGVTVNPTTPHAVSYRGEELNGLARIALALDSPGVLFNREGYVKPLMLNSRFLKLVCDEQ